MLLKLCIINGVHRSKVVCAQRTKMMCCSTNGSQTNSGDCGKHAAKR